MNGTISYADQQKCRKLGEFFETDKEVRTDDADMRPVQ
jgi:hypothetical protein